MILWIDAQLSPQLGPWITQQFGIQAVAIRDVGLRDAEDIDIFNAARTAKAVVLTKDSDFRDLVLRLGAPPQVLWLTCGNTSNRRMREILEQSLPKAITLLDSGDPLVEITDLG